jgi:hypothetical protein
MRRPLCVLALLLSASCNPPPPTQPTAPDATAPVSKDFRLSGPYTHENLTVFLIHKPGIPAESVSYLTLEEALQAKTLKVTEKADGAQVNQLEVENTGDQPVYLQAGDTVKGGKQDRTIGVDLVLPPKSGKRELAAFCVEPGRWSARAAGRDIQIATAAVAFDPAPAPVATKEQKLAVRLEQSQEKVWEEGRKANAGLVAKAPLTEGGTTAEFESAARSLHGASYVLTTEAPAVAKKTSEYTDALGRILDGKEDVVGMAFAVNGEPSTVEVYAGPTLFRKLWPKLLKGAALEAISKKPEQPVTKKVTEEDIRSLLAQAPDGKASRRELSGDVSMETVDGVKCATFETKVKGEFLHRQVLTK